MHHAAPADLDDEVLHLQHPQPPDGTEEDDDEDEVDDDDDDGTVVAGIAPGVAEESSVKRAERQCPGPDGAEPTAAATAAATFLPVSSSVSPKTWRRSEWPTSA
jgi:hypothetical protein